MSQVKETAVPTQEFIEIEEIKQDTIILHSGGLRKILIVTGLNFDLKSEEEQGIIIYSFQNLLNSLNFSLQIFIHSRKINIEDYLAKLAIRQNEESVELLRNIIGGYQEFISSFVGQNPIMEKSFFITVPYDPIQISQAGKDFGNKLFNFFKKTPAPPDANARQQNFNVHLEQLSQRVDQVINNLSQIGLRAVLLNESEIVELFYNLYNPETVEKRL